MRIFLPLLAFLIVCSSTAASAVRGRRAMFVGGTVEGIKKGAKAEFDATGLTHLRFGTQKHILLEVPFQNISTVEYGQHAGRRVRAALLGGGIPALFSHKRKHFVTIYFLDEKGKQQAAIFELGKKTVRETLTLLRVKTGKEIEFQSEDARKNLGHP